MKYSKGQLIAIIVALVFVLFSVVFSVGIVVHGIHQVQSGKNVSVSKELQETKEKRDEAKARKQVEKEAEKAAKAGEKKAEKNTEKQAAEKKPETTSKKSEKKTSAKKATQKQSKTASDGIKAAAATPKSTTTKKTTTAKATTKKTTTKKTTKKTTTTQKTTTTTKKTTTTKHTTQKADGSKVVYLTFDDGPGPYTDQLLGILAKHGVKATFFVTNCYSDYQSCIAKEYKAGHAVAVHSYTHNYATIYQSDSAYWSDFNKMNDVIRKQTGSTTTMFRFPGGSSNTVSKKYNSGIMSRLTKQAGQKGLTYYDWNVTSGDAGETTSSDRVYKNIVNQVKNQKQSIILCHDIKSYTVNAMDRTIQWLQDNGYTFKTLVPGGYTVHHSVAN